MDAHDEAFEAGERSARRALAPLVEGIIDALVMFENIERNRQLPAFGAEQAQYVAMGKSLRRLLDLSGLKDALP